MPRENLSFNEGVNFLKLASGNIVICLFNSLNDIINNKNNLKKIFIEALRFKTNFSIVCNYTRGGNHVLAYNEECFLKSLCRELSKNFSFKRLEVLGGEGITISGTRK